MGVATWCNFLGGQSHRVAGITKCHMSRRVAESEYWNLEFPLQKSHKILTWRNGSVIPDTLCSGLYPVMTKDLRFLTRGMACTKMDQFQLIIKPWEMRHSVHASIYNIIDES